MSCISYTRHTHTHRGRERETLWSVKRNTTKRLFFISLVLLKKKLSSYLTFQSDSRAIKVSSTLDSLSVNSPLYVLTFLGVKRPLLKFERSRRCVRRVFGANRALFVFFVVAFDMRFVLTPNSFFFFLTFPQKKKKNKKRQREREREDILLLLLLRYI